MTKHVLVHPDDVNIADAKAVCAQLGVNAGPSNLIPRGYAIVIDPDAAKRMLQEALAKPMLFDITPPESRSPKSP